MAPSVPTDTVDNVGEVLRLRKPSTKFGRSRSENDFYLDSPKFQKLISRRHAEIHRTEPPAGAPPGKKGQAPAPEYTIQDSSLNGTFINDYRVSKQRQPLKHGDIITFGHLNGSRVKPGEHAPNRLAELSYIFEVDEKNEEDEDSDTDQESDADSRPESAQSPKAQSSDDEEEDDAEAKKKKALKNGVAAPPVPNGEGELFGGKPKPKPAKPVKVVGGVEAKSPKSASKKPMVFDQNENDGSDSSEDSDDEDEDDDSDDSEDSEDESSAGEEKATPSIVSETIYQTPRSNNSPAKAGDKRRGRPSGAGGGSKKGGTSPVSSPPAKARKVAAGESASSGSKKAAAAAAATGGRPPGVLSEVKARGKGSSAPAPTPAPAPAPITPKASSAKSTPKATSSKAASNNAKSSSNKKGAAATKGSPKASDKKASDKKADKKGSSKKAASKKTSKVDSKKVKSKATVESDAESSGSESSGADSDTKASQFMWHKDEYDVCASKKCLRPPGKRIQWVACDACDEWYHTECVGVSFEDVNKKDFEFFCGCSKSKGNKRKK